MRAQLSDLVTEAIAYRQCVELRKSWDHPLSSQYTVVTDLTLVAHNVMDTSADALEDTGSFRFTPEATTNTGRLQQRALAVRTPCLASSA